MTPKNQEKSSQEELGALAKLKVVQRLRLITSPPEARRPSLGINVLKDRQLEKVHSLLLAGWQRQRIVQIICQMWGYKQLSTDRVHRDLKRLLADWKAQEEAIALEAGMKGVTYTEVEPPNVNIDPATVEAEIEELKDEKIPASPKYGKLPKLKADDLVLDNPRHHDPSAGLLWLLKIQIERITQFRKFEAEEGPPLEELTDAIELAKDLEKTYLDAAIKVGHIRPADGQAGRGSAVSAQLDRFSNLLSANIGDKDKLAGVVTKMSLKLESLIVQDKNLLPADFEDAIDTDAVPPTSATGPVR